MLSLFNPWVILGVVLALLGSFGSGYWKGSSDEEAQQQIEIARLNEQARETEQRMGEVAQTYAQTLRKANNVAKAKETKLRTDIASGERKLFIPVKTSCPVPSAGDAASVAGDSRETRTELDRSVAEALIAITADGDQAIRKLNACIDQYEKMRSIK